MNLAEACFRLTRELPKEETYGLSSQIRRAAVSIPANIAEGHGREQNGSFVQFLRVAQGSLKELETHLILIERVEMAAPGRVGPLLGNCDTLGRMLRGLIKPRQTRGTQL